MKSIIEREATFENNSDMEVKVTQKQLSRALHFSGHTIIGCSTGRRWSRYSHARTNSCCHGPTKQKRNSQAAKPALEATKVAALLCRQNSIN